MSQSNAERQARYRVRHKLLELYPGASIPDDVVVLRVGAHYGLYDADTGAYVGRFSSLSD